MAYVNVVFNSNYKTSGTNSNANYYIDWSAILQPNTKYLLQWTYLGQVNTFNNPKLAGLYMNIIGENYTSSTSGAPLSLNFGNLFEGNIGLYATINDNTPILLNSRPTNNYVNIQILTNDNPPVEWTDNAAIPVPPANYILTLTFSEVLDRKIQQ